MVFNICEVDKLNEEFRPSRKSCKKCENKQRVQRKYSKLKTDILYKKSQQEYDAKRKREKRKTISKDSIQYVRESISRLIRRSISGRGFKKNARTHEILGCSYEFVREYIASQFEDGMSWDNHAFDTWHIDHIIPSCAGDTYEKIIAINHYTNFRPLWGSENLSKSGKII